MLLHRAFKPQIRNFYVPQFYAHLAKEILRNTYKMIDCRKEAAEEVRTKIFYKLY